MNKCVKDIIIVSVLLLALAFCSGSCNEKLETCHRVISIVNNSDSVISICRFGWIDANHCGLGKISEIKSKDTVDIEMFHRWCLEELLLENQPATNYTLCVLPENFSYIHTTLDSLEISYNILKTIDLVELGPDSLLKTDYTVYYP